MSRKKCVRLTCAPWRASRLNHPRPVWMVFRRALMKLNRKSWPRLVRGLLSLSVLLGICAMLFPLPIAPLPQDSPEKDSSEPFPCQNRPCGCRSADQCWKKCCCFNNNQKIAWAKANNVKVPDYVLAAAKKENEHSGSLEICSAPASKHVKSSAITSNGCCEHCSKKSADATTQKKRGSRIRQSSEVPRILTNPATSEPRIVANPATSECLETRAKPPKSKWVLAICAAECQGQGPPAFCFPTSIVPELVALVIPIVAEIETVPLESERLRQASLGPPLPPPKIV